MQAFVTPVGSCLRATATCHDYHFYCMIYILDWRPAINLYHCDQIGVQEKVHTQGDQGTGYQSDTSCTLAWYRLLSVTRLLCCLACRIVHCEQTVTFHNELTKNSTHAQSPRIRVVDCYPESTVNYHYLQHQHIYPHIV